MANTQFASTPDRERSSARRARRRGWLALALPLAALLALVLVPAVAFAGGPTPGPVPGIALSPSSGPVGTHVSASGTNFHAGDHISIGYSTRNCGSGVVPISGAPRTAPRGGQRTTGVP